MTLLASHDLHIISIVFSRTTAPVEVREQVAAQDWPAIFGAWRELVREWAILSTCHRFELYLATSGEQVDRLSEQLQTTLAEQIDPALSASRSTQGQRPWLVHLDADAVRHLCCVAAGLDSVVVGEAQIQGQVIATYTRALEARTIGPMLSMLFRTAIRAGKRARTETAISTRAVSMSSMALSMAARHIADFAHARVLVIGAGEMSRLALKALAQRQVTHVTVANRTLARAEAALLHPAWRAVPLAHVAESLGDYDVIFSATHANGFIVTRAMAAQASAARPPVRPQVYIDLAVPRDIEPSVRGLARIELIDVDDLRLGLDESQATRTRAIPAVNAIIDDELERWQVGRRELSMRPYVVELRQRAERIRQHEVERTMRFLGPVDAATREHIHHLSRALVNKLLHEPTVRIKELAHEDEAESYVEAICDIFGLNGESEDSQDAEPSENASNAIRQP